jgi:solute carrier family 39 (zinc transporter), member 1/2/3
MSNIVIDGTFWLKIGFIVFVFFEAFLSGLIPVFSKSCRESPKILGIANSFASGVFIAIALVHILPEMSGLWISDKGEEAFPLPYFLVFCGYTLILVIDKVMFDTHALFDHNDEAEGTAEQRLNENLKRSFANDGTSKVQAQDDLQTGIKEYLSTPDRFSARLKASFKGDDRSQATADQQ